MYEPSASTWVSSNADEVVKICSSVALVSLAMKLVFDSFASNDSSY